MAVVRENPGEAVNGDVLAVEDTGEDDVDAVGSDEVRVRRLAAAGYGDMEARDEGWEVRAGGEGAECGEGEAADGDVVAEGADVGAGRGGNVKGEEGGVCGCEEGVGGVGAQEVEVEVGGDDGIAEEVVAPRPEGGDGGVQLIIGDRVRRRGDEREKDKDNGGEREKERV